MYQDSEADDPYRTLHTNHDDEFWMMITPCFSLSYLTDIKISTVLFDIWELKCLRYQKVLSISGYLSSSRVTLKFMSRSSETPSTVVGCTSETHRGCQIECERTVNPVNLLPICDSCRDL
jgi:hypothetical protein